MGEPGDRCGGRRGEQRPAPRQEWEEEEGEERGRGPGRAAPGVGPRWPAQPLKCNPWGTGFSLMRPLQGCRGRGVVVGTVTLCLAAGWALQSKWATPALSPLRFLPRLFPPPLPRRATPGMRRKPCLTPPERGDLREGLGTGHKGARAGTAALRRLQKAWEGSEEAGERSGASPGLQPGRGAAAAGGRAPQPLRRAQRRAAASPRLYQ